MSLLVVLLGFLVAAAGATTGVAIVAASRLELTRWVARRLQGADAAITTLARPGDIASVAGALVALGVTVAGVSAPWALRNAGFVLTLTAELVVGLPLIGLLVYFLPRAIGRRWPETILRSVVPRLGAATRLVGRIIRGRIATERAELAALLRDSTTAGLAREDELEIVTGVMAFTDRRVREVMTPRTRILAAPDTATTAELADLVVRSGYTRLPLYKGSLDEIVGMTHAFDLLKAGPSGTVRVRPVVTLPGSRRCADALLDMKRERRHLGVVLDEFGGTAGIVTMEDLLEELVGEIFDELDEPTVAPAPGTPAVLVAEGALPLQQVAEHFAVTLDPPPRVETAGGYAAWIAGRIPQAGERLLAGPLEIDILDATPQRVARLVIRLAAVPPSAPAPGRAP